MTPTTTTTADQIARLYDAVFGRAPDAGGLSFWTTAADHGLTLHQMAAQFVAVPEFAATYGQPTDQAFVQAMYENTLHRAPDAGGKGQRAPARVRGRDAPRNRLLEQSLALP